MPRTARKRSSTGIYHVMQRGINKQNIFLDYDDYARYLNTFYKYAVECKINILGYCLMKNHVHLLLKENEISLAILMKKIGSSFVYKYNEKYDRVGHLFQDRFKSEVVENDKYLLTVLRYIHNNPVVAGLVENIQDYKWSSYKNYVYNKGFINTSLVLDILSEKAIIAKKKYVRFMGLCNDDKCLDIANKVRLSDKKAEKLIKDYCEINDLNQLKEKDIANKKELYNHFITNFAVSYRQLARLTGDSRERIMKMLNSF